MQLLDCLHSQIITAFEKRPHEFFTEHDIHTQLALVASKLLEEEGNLYGRTLDGFVVGRVHHEYPTPFRCIMKNSEFRLVTEDQFLQEKQKNPKFRARRGFLDFAIINSEYISSNKLNVVSGKRYRELVKSLKNRRHVALDLAVEVVYYPTFDERLHDGIMNKRVSSIVQDYQKLVAVMEFMPDNVPFCRKAAMMFFSNTTHKDVLKEKLRSLPKHEKVTFYSVFSE